MGSLMDLIAGDPRDIVLALAVEDWSGFADPDRFPAHLSFGGGLDPTWLDLFSEAARDVTGLGGPADLIDARTELEGPAAPTDRIVELVDPAWTAAVAAVPDERVGALAGRWIALLEEDEGVHLPREEKPWIRELAGRVVEFCRAAQGTDAVVFAWGF